jgi:hypothetical protein
LTVLQANVATAIPVASAARALRIRRAAIAAVRGEGGRWSRGFESTPDHTMGRRDGALMTSLASPFPFRAICEKMVLTD